MLGGDAGREVSLRAGSGHRQGHCDFVVTNRIGKCWSPMSALPQSLYLELLVLEQSTLQYQHCVSSPARGTGCACVAGGTRCQVHPIALLRWGRTGVTALERAGGFCGAISSCKLPGQL